MKKSRIASLFCCMLAVFLFSACATTQCECGNNTKYKQRKARISLINSQKNSTFAAQKEFIV